MSTTKPAQMGGAQTQGQQQEPQQQPQQGQTSGTTQQQGGRTIRDWASI